MLMDKPQGKPRLDFTNTIINTGVGVFGILIASFMQGILIGIAWRFIVPRHFSFIPDCIKYLSPFDMAVTLFVISALSAILGPAINNLVPKIWR